MKLEEIEEAWEKDGKFDTTALDNEALRIPNLHHKYYKIYAREQLVQKKYQMDYNELRRVKMEYYKGQLDFSTLKAHGWKQFNLQLSNREVDVYLDSDIELNKLSFRVQAQNIKIKYLESILSTIAFRNQSLKNAIEFLKFTNGVI
jgi:hypothetical protein